MYVFWLKRHVPGSHWNLLDWYWWHRNQKKIIRDDGNFSPFIFFVVDHCYYTLNFWPSSRRSKGYSSNSKALRRSSERRGRSTGPARSFEELKFPPIFVGRGEEGAYLHIVHLEYWELTKSEQFMYSVGRARSSFAYRSPWLPGNYLFRKFHGLVSWTDVAALSQLRKKLDLSSGFEPKNPRCDVVPLPMRHFCDESTKKS